MKRTYANDKIKVFWDSEKCIHAGYCTGGLPQVFDTSKRPWIDINGADPEEIKRVVDLCPTGALAYEVPHQPEQPAVTIQVLKDGPYRICGNVRLTDPGGNVIETGRICALCRCGGTKRSPFCDGSHRRIHFKDMKQEAGRAKQEE